MPGMKVRVYAVLKDYFEQEFEIAGDIRNTEELMASLVAVNAGAEEILTGCRFAVDEDFIEKDYKLQGHETVIIIPPGSGG
jgi:molybdopterin synthase sulfur carrier subunit